MRVSHALKRVGEVSDLSTTVWGSTRRADRQAVTPEEGHKGRGEGMQALVESGERPLSTDGIAEKDSEKIDHLVVAETATSKAHLLAKAFQHLLVT